jgi:hypothetical protein
MLCYLFFIINYWTILVLFREADENQDSGVDDNRQNAEETSSIKPSTFRKSVINDEVKVNAVFSSSFMQAMSANPGGNPKSRLSISSIPPPLNTKLGKEDMVNNAPVAPLTAPAASTSAKQSTPSQSETSPSVEKRGFRSPPPIPGSNPKMSPTVFTFDNVALRGRSYSEDVNSPTEEDTSEVVLGSSNRTPIKSVNNGISEVPSPTQNEVSRKSSIFGNAFRSIKNAVGGKSNLTEIEVVSSEANVSNSDQGSVPPRPNQVPPPPPPKRASTISIAPPPIPTTAPPTIPIKRSSTIEISEDISQGRDTFPDAKNVEIFERNLHFFKKLKEVNTKL